MFHIEEELKKLPKQPGVYIMHDAQDTILYVGKAINLHNRVRSYFRPNIGRGPQSDKMVKLIDHFEYIVTDSELEALVLENNLIKEHRPKYNTLLKDDKTYPYIKVTVGEEYPRVLFSREMKKDKSRYFGPFTSAAAVKDTIELINRLYQLRTCNKKFPRDFGADRPCLNHHIGRCMAPCRGIIPKEVYGAQVEKALDFLNGNYQPILKELEEKMTQASENLDFEEAIRYRELLQSVRSVSQKQKIEGNGDDKDIIALAKDGADAVAQVFFVRNGRLIGREHFYMTHVSDESKSDILQSFVKQFYSGTPFIPKELMLQMEIAEREIIEAWLSERRNSRVYIRVPKIGSKEKLVELAAQNAALVLSRDKERIKREEGRTIGAVKEIAALLGLEKLQRMEAFDISNISGVLSVASMVVFEQGKPKKNAYRKFRLRTVTGPDDYASMKEVLSRRFTDEKMDILPDVIMMDGGKGQVNVALMVLDSLGLDIPVCGMVKDDNHRTRGLYYNNVEVKFPKGSEAMLMVTALQDEAHRFAIEYHRQLRSKNQVHSVLDEIPGVGENRRKQLLKYFGEIRKIKEATVGELAEVPGIPESVAKNVYDFFHVE